MILVHSKISMEMRILFERAVTWYGRQMFIPVFIEGNIFNFYWNRQEKSTECNTANNTQKSGNECGSAVRSQVQRKNAVREAGALGDGTDLCSNIIRATAAGSMAPITKTPHDYSQDLRDSAPKEPRLRTEKKLTAFQNVARPLSRTDTSEPLRAVEPSVAHDNASSTVPIHIPRHGLDDDEASMCTESHEESPFNEPPDFSAEGTPRSADCILRLSWPASCARSEGAQRSTRGSTFWFSAQSLVLSEAHVCSG